MSKTDALSAAKHTLAADGFRFLERNGVFAWVHPAEAFGYLEAGAVDTTDMDDETFEAYVKATGSAS